MSSEFKSVLIVHYCRSGKSNSCSGGKGDVAGDRPWQKSSRVAAQRLKGGQSGEPGGAGAHCQGLPRQRGFDAGRVRCHFGEGCKDLACNFREDSTGQLLYQEATVTAIKRDRIFSVL
jgi:hypothetical protein